MAATSSTTYLAISTNNLTYTYSINGTCCYNFRVTKYHAQIPVTDKEQKDRLSLKTLKENLKIPAQIDVNTRMMPLRSEAAKRFYLSHLNH